MPKFASVNAIVIAVSLIILLLVYIYDRYVLDAVVQHQAKSDDHNEQRPNGAEPKAELIYLNYPSIRSAYWYFFGALTWLFISYLLTDLDPIETGLSNDSKELAHQVTHALKSSLSNLANVSLLVAAIAYARGENFDAANARRWFGRIAILIALWTIFWELVHHDRSLFFSALFTAPDVILSNIALIALGWVFLSRWKGVGVAYFVVTICYAVLQLPARIALDLQPFLDPNKAVDLEPTFYLLAVGKILLIGGFILILRKITTDIDEPRFWPREPRSSPYPIRDVALALLFGFTVPFVLHWGNEAVAGGCCTWPNF